MQKLLNIQQALKTPKGQYNKFGGFKYRSCEDIILALKPILALEKVVLLMDDDIVSMGHEYYTRHTEKDGKLEDVTMDGERFYVKSTVKLVDVGTGEIIAQAVAYAREDIEKAGTDGSQITGSSSSYARKRALSGLLMIDDGVDADKTNTYDGKEKEMSDDDKEWITKDQIIAMKDKKDWIRTFKDAESFVKAAREKYKVSKENAKALEEIYNLNTKANENGGSTVVVD